MENSIESKNERNYIPGGYCNTVGDTIEWHFYTEDNSEEGRYHYNETIADLSKVNLSEDEEKRLKETDENAYEFYMNQKNKKEDMIKSVFDFLMESDEEFSDTVNEAVNEASEKMNSTFDKNVTEFWKYMDNNKVELKPISIGKKVYQMPDQIGRPEFNGYIRGLAFHDCGDGTYDAKSCFLSNSQYGPVPMTFIDNVIALDEDTMNKSVLYIIGGIGPSGYYIPFDKDTDTAIECIKYLERNKNH